MKNDSEVEKNQYYSNMCSFCITYACFIFIVCEFEWHDNETGSGIQTITTRTRKLVHGYKYVILINVFG